MTTRRPGRLAAAAALALALALAGSTQLSPAQAETGHAGPAAPSTTGTASAPTSFVLSSFNLLGASHTGPNGERPRWARGAQRMVWATQLLDQHGIDVVGFQEMQQSQFDRFEKIDGATWDIFPGEAIGTAAMANSIAWRTADWTLVESRTVPVPYFHGNMIRKPLVLLQNVHTGQQAWFLNTHNPADKKGAAQKWRNQAVDIEARTVNELQAADPDVPVFLTGDMNDRANCFCRITAASSLLAANGGSNTGGACVVPKPTQIDWILGTPQARFTGYTATKDGLVSKTTDHPLVYATVGLAPAPAEGAADHVVVIDVEGLRSRGLERAVAAGQAPVMGRMISEGAATLNARTEVESTDRLPNVLGMLTGRPVDPASGGHGYAWADDNGSTVRSAHGGKYVSSVLDLVHNLGGSTALFGNRHQLDLVRRSWDATNGGADKYLPDDGRDKVTTYADRTTDGGTVRATTAQLSTDPAAFTFVHLSGLARTGVKQGWMQPKWFARLASTDRLVGRVLAAVEADPELAAGTVVVLTSDYGGRGHDASDPTRVTNYRVPLLVWGAGVAQGTDLYALNPAYTKPGGGRPAYDAAAQPIRSGVVANLALGLLGLPAVPGSSFDPAQDLAVLAPVTG